MTDNIESRKNLMDSKEDALRRAAEKHGIKRSSTEYEFMSEEDFLKHEKDKADRLQNMVQNFKWEDDVPVKTETSLTVGEEELYEAASSVIRYIIDNINMSDFKPETFKTFEVKIPACVTIHKVLPMMFNQSCDEDSRLDVFDNLNNVYVSSLPRFIEELNAKISNIMSPKGDKWEIEVDGVKITSDSVTKLSNWTVLDSWLEMNDEVSVDVAVYTPGFDSEVNKYTDTKAENSISAVITLDYKTEENEPESGQS